MRESYFVASLCLAIVLLAALAGAQTKDPAPASGQPSYNQQAPQRLNCEILAGKHWLVLTDPNTTQEDAAFHRQAAEAYEHLAAMSWPC